MRAKNLVIVVCALALAACTTDRENEPFGVAPGSLDEAAQPQPQQQQQPAAPSGAQANEAERTAKRDWNKTPKPTVETIDWAEANGYPHLSIDQLPAAEREKIATIALPVMLPSDRDLLDTAIITRGENWYAVSLKDVSDKEGTASLHLRGTRVSFDFEGDVWTDAEKAIGDTYTLTRTHQLVSVSFGAFGAAYTLDVECSRPMDDIRCTDDTYAMELANELVVAGGLR